MLIGDCHSLLHGSQKLASYGCIATTRGEPRCNLPLLFHTTPSHCNMFVGAPQFFKLLLQVHERSL
ncbi:hypothetical protein V4C53_35320 [Paraburkholderia azotifigens]|uniref:hypothetical protein n=1 Tax=Paraburkholderia azotifigens TaxID=2057004 RepID=UPI00317BB4DA